MKSFKKVLLGVGLTSLMAVQAIAVPWCHRGTIVQVADVAWSGSTTVAMAGGIAVPPGLSDPARYQVFHATNNYCQSYAGGGGPIWGTSVPGSGSVNTIPYAPHVLTNTVNPYDLSMGVSFKCNKCYAIPPLVQIHEFRSVEPLPGTEGKLEYEKKVEER